MNKVFSQPLLKVDAVVKTSKPIIKTDLKLFLAMMHYYDKFIKNLLTLLHPLNLLLREGHTWKWTTDYKRVLMKLRIITLSVTKGPLRICLCILDLKGLQL